MVCYVSICDNPDCGAVHVQGHAIDDRVESVEKRREKVAFTLCPGADLEADPLPKGMFSASVDLHSGELTVHSDLSVKRHDEMLLASFRRQLDGALHEILRKRWRRVRKKTDRTGWRRDDWSWWEPGTMVPWAKVFPDDPDFIVRRDRRLYWAMDTYCVTPDCSCHEIVVCFFEEGSRKIGRPVGDVHADFDDWRLTEVHPAEGDTEMLHELWEALVQRRDFRKEVPRRHRKLKKVGREIPRLRSNGR